MSFIVIVILPLVVLLFALIWRINNSAHFAPQAYHRKKIAGAPVALEFDALAPRPRKTLESPAPTPRTSERARTID